MTVPTALLLVNLASTWFMTGLIWFVQVVHYPQFFAVGAGVFPTYHKQHMRLTTLVVAPAMLLEAATAMALLVWRPASAEMWMLWTGVALLGVIWISTTILQVPQHRRLAAEFCGTTCRTLCRGNWVRTIAWTARAALMFAATAAVI